MTYVLTLPQQSPLKRSFSDTPYIQPSTSPLAENGSTSTILRLSSRNDSPNSFASCYSSQPSPKVDARSRSRTPITSGLLSPLDLNQIDRSASPFGSSPSCPVTRSTSLEARPIAAGRSRSENLPPHQSSTQLSHDVGVIPSAKPYSINTPSITFSIRSSSSTHTIECPETSTSEGGDDDVATDDESSVQDADGISDDHVSTQPFMRWVASLRKRHRYRQKTLQQPRRKHLSNHDNDHHSILSDDDPKEGIPHSARSMTSSLGFVTAVKSASITVASTHGHLTRRNTNRLRLQRSDQTVMRCSVDSNVSTNGPLLDEAAWARSIQRRKILEELLSSEESYISDLKALSNVYLTVLASVPSITDVSRAAVQRNVTQILHMHEHLLAELQRVIPRHEWTLDGNFSTPQTKSRHVRWQSADVPRPSQSKLRPIIAHRRSADIPRRFDMSTGTVAETKTAMEVAKVFNSFMRKFFAYEEYGAQYEAMCRDLSLTYKVVPGWNMYEKGFETLATSITPMNRRPSGGKKGLTFADLLIKPIQRVCKYPLLFSDLCRQTPVYDDPDTHAELAKVLFRLQETTGEIDKATVDPKMRKLIETTWQIQDRMVFEDQLTPSAIKTRLLGHVLLCGTLHVAYQTNGQLTGQYMICVLYKSCMLIATLDKSISCYNVAAAIPLANGNVQEPDNGRGLQCHTAPYTWKLLFEFSRRVYELIFSACSAAEEEAWRSCLSSRIAAENHDVSEGRSNVQDLFCSLALDLKPIATIFGQPEGIMRRMSIHRSPTTAPKTNPHQVIIKNTHAQKVSPDDSQSTVSLPVGRSQSHMSATNIPTLVPRRADRIRIETALSDVWTRDVIPYPGMGVRRPEHPIRASANSVIRKLSMASIASNFSRQSNYSKRSASYASLDPERIVEESNRTDLRNKKRPSPSSHPSGSGYKPPKLNRSDKQQSAQPVLVDFHNTPSAFLPADFDLDAVRPPSNQRRLENRALAAMDQDSQICASKATKSAINQKVAGGSLPPNDRGLRTMSLKSTGGLGLQAVRESQETITSLHPSLLTRTNTERPVVRSITPTVETPIKLNAVERKTPSEIEKEADERKLDPPLHPSEL